ncbi:MAG: alpha/beta hydrolase [Pseudomonadota bacterium]
MTITLVLVALAIATPYFLEARRKPMTAKERKSAPGQMVELTDGVTHYQWHGPVRGPVAVCVHGLTTPSFVWEGLAAGLAALGYRVLTYDLYGRGYSDRPAGAQTADFFNQQLEELLTSQEIDDDITLIGNSMGGPIATSFTAQHTTRVRHLVLLAPAGVIEISSGLTKFVRGLPYIGDWLMLALFPSLHRHAVNAERDLPTSVPDITTRQKNELRFRGFVPAILSSYRGILGKTREPEHRKIHQAGVPVLAIWGRQDDIIPLSAMGQLTEWSRAAHQEVIEDAGHGLTYTHTEQVLDVLSERLEDGLN